MKLGLCVAKNFASYTSLEFNFQDQGLSLVSGPTGAGKSTLVDMACWALFGVTAKDGNVDEVRSWTAQNESTSVTQEVHLEKETIYVTRVRGRTSENDLFWTRQESPDTKIRGKDLHDTQKLLNETLGFDEEIFLTAAYFHEFSETGKFFSASAKARRSLFERVVSLATPIRITEGASSKLKLAFNAHKVLRKEESEQTARLAECSRHTSSLAASSKAWARSQTITCERLAEKSANFEEDRQRAIEHSKAEIEAWEETHRERLKALQAERDDYNASIQLGDWDASIHAARQEYLKLNDSVCDKCGSFVTSKQRSASEQNIHKYMKIQSNNYFCFKSIERVNDQIQLNLAEINPHKGRVTALLQRENTYGYQLELERRKTNPHGEQLEAAKAEGLALKSQLLVSQQHIQEAERTITALDMIKDLADQMRGLLLTQAVKAIQDSTNNYLEKYFDAEIRVDFKIEGADNLNVSITKNGYDCVFTQLSKGQRQLLKLCFAISVMTAASNKCGIHFDSLFFDEALDGPDTVLKVKAFSLFEDLSKSHGSIFIVEHSSEFKQLFDKRYEVTLVEDKSHIEEAT